VPSNPADTLDPSAAEPRPSASNRVSRISDDLIWASLSIFAVLLANLLISAVLARRGVQVFEGYNLGKRLASTAVPLLVMGLNLGLAKLLAEVSGALRERRIVAGYRLVLSLTILMSVVLVLMPRMQVFIVGSAGWEFWALWAYTLGMTFNLVVYSTHRGSLAQSKANRNNILAVGLLPALVVLIAPSSTTATVLLALIGAVLLLTQGLRVAWIAFRGGVQPVSRDDYALLLRYSMPRLPAGILAAAALAVGPWVVHRAGASADAAFLLAGLSVIQLAGAAFAGFSMVLLPRISAMAIAGDVDKARRTVGSVVSLMLVGCAGAVPVLFLGMRSLVQVWLGPNFMAAVPILRIFALGIPAVVLYGVLTSVTDAAVRFPVNTLGASLALLGAAAPALFGASDATSLGIGFVVGQWVAALLICAATISVLGPMVFTEVGFTRLLFVLLVAIGAGYGAVRLIPEAPVLSLLASATVAGAAVAFGLRGTLVATSIESRIGQLRRGDLS